MIPLNLAVHQMRSSMVRTFGWTAIVALMLVAGPQLRAQTPVVNDTTTSYGSGIQPMSAPCLGSCDLTPSYNHYLVASPFQISKITFKWQNNGGNNCDGVGNYGAIISATGNVSGILATSTNSIYLGCAGFSPGGTSGTGELDFSDQTIPASFYLDFATVDGGVQGGAQIVVYDVEIWQSAPPNSVNLFAACINGFQVDVNGAAAPGASVTSIAWNWGDGATTTGFFPQSHTYTTQGQYTVRVTANYNDGSSASSSESVNVGAAVLSNCIALTIKSGQYGSVSYQASIGSGTVPAGSYTTLQLGFADDLTLDANPAPAFSFSDWLPSAGITATGGTPVNTTSPSIQIVVGSASTINANFVLSLTVPPTPTTTPPLSSFPPVSGLFTSQATSFSTTFENQTSSNAQNWLTSSSISTNISTANNFLGLSFGLGYKQAFGQIKTGASTASTVLSVATISLDPASAVGAVGNLMAGVGILEQTPEFQTLNPTQQVEQQVVFDGFSIGINCITAGTSGGLALNFTGACATSLAGAAMDVTSDVASALQSDPQDPNYTQVFVPQPIVASSVPLTAVSKQLGTAAWASLSAVDETTMWANALRVTANRYGTALANGDASDAGMQYMAFLNYFGLYLHSAGIASADLTQLANLLNAQGLGTQQVTSEDIQNGLTFLETQGASSSFINSFFTSLGFTSDQIQTMIEQAEANPPSPPSVTPVQALKTLAEAFATSGVHLVATLKSLKLDSQNDQYIVTLNITNTGATTASNVTLTGAELNSRQTSTAVPISVGNLPYAAFATATVTFSASAGALGSLALLKVSETYSGGTAGGGFRVTLP